MKKLLYICVVLVSLLTNHINAQVDTPIQDLLDNALKAEIGLASRPSSDSIILRWGASNPSVWEIGLEHGYTIEKAEINADVTDYERLDYQPLADNPFLPWTEEQWENNLEQMDTLSEDYNLAIVAESLVYFQDDETEQEFVPLLSEGLNSLEEGKRISENRFGFAMLVADRSTSAANGLGLRYVDRDIEAGKTYVYKISLNGASDVYTVSKAYHKVSAIPFNSSSLKSSIEAEEGEQLIKFSWKNISGINSYFVERSEDGVNFTKLNNTPIASLTPENYEGESRAAYVDDSLNNYQYYWYRFYGTTVFADQVLIGEAKAMPRDQTPPNAPFLKQPEHILNEELVKLEWEISTPIESDLEGFRVFRGKTNKGPFEEITDTPIIGTQLDDRNFDLDGSNFYFVAAIDTSGNMSRSRVAYVTIVDETPPAIPVLLSGEIDTLGIVTIDIKPNVENDFMGYRILRSNADDHEYSVIYESFSNNKDEVNTSYVFKDTVSLKTLTKGIYYKASSLDKNYNESNLSDVLVVERPDTIVPVTPLIDNYLVTDKYVELEIIESSSEDVIAHYILKKKETDTDWQRIKIELTSNGKWRDENLEQGVYYEYALEAEDDGGLVSERSNKVTVKCYFKGLLDTIQPDVTYSKEEQLASISWNIPETLQQNYVVLLFKKESDESPSILAELKNSTQFSFIDSKLKIDQQYAYGLKIYADNKESLLVFSSPFSTE